MRSVFFFAEAVAGPRHLRRPPLVRWVALAMFAACVPPAFAHERQLEEVVISASRSEQTSFDAPAAISSVSVDPGNQARPLVNLSELLSTVPGLQARDRQNYAQDLQLSVRGFGTRSTFGVRGVRILVDGIPATMPDGQGQAATASLNSASRIEVLRGPLAQLYGNAAGGVVQIFTRDPAAPPSFTANAGAGSHGQRQVGASLSGGSKELAGLIDVTHFSTDGYRDHSAAQRTQANVKVVARPTEATSITGIYNWFHQPMTQDPLGLTRAQYLANPRQVFAGANTFDTRKSIEQQQGGVVLEHRLTAIDTLHARAYAGTRQIFQTLAFQNNGVVDLDRGYGGIGLAWSRKTRVNGLPLNWTAGIDADRQRERRKGFDNNSGTPGTLRRDENGEASNLDAYGQMDWAVHPQWRLIAGVRASRVRLAVDDYFIVGGNPNDSGSVQYRQTSPVLGTVWHASHDLNVYANLGQGFETPTLAEAAYRAVGSGPNFSLRSSTSKQGEIGLKLKRGRHAFEAALFTARSDNEIVPSQVVAGRTVYQNVDDVERRGLEAAWQAQWNGLNSRLAYTLVDASFRRAYTNAQGATIASGNRLPGVPLHALAAEVSMRHHGRMQSALEMRVESKTWVNDINSDAAPAFAVFNLRTGIELPAGRGRTMLFARIDNLLDRRYAGSVIVNDGNGRFYEPAPGRSFFVGLRTAL
ncbi:TonB-dependent receptor family protein [Lacisediminimonas profundi]|uniref:TonB-dependent receptor family protein n=1 Tax=Lacisediminimonas profundi TaxID=2603856 RepID=UPI001F4F4A75|nr:TonB-dependent receptor [Lacisediminimonas profundi]